MNTVSPQLGDIYLVLQPFIADVTGLDPSLVIQGLPNRVAMPEADPGFITMQAILQTRLNTNIKEWDPTDPAPTQMNSEMHVRLSVQIDCYGAASLAWATMLQTLLRDSVGCDALAPTCQPLYTGDPQMLALDDSESQYEQRWMLQAELQYNPITTVAQQFADALEVDVINVDVTYPPA